MNNYFKKISFRRHLDPTIEKRNDSSNYIPDGIDTVLIIYADFELSWAWRYAINRTVDLREQPNRD